jgi:hypothetical protein
LKADRHLTGIDENTYCFELATVSEAKSSTTITWKAAQLKVALGGVPTVVKGWICPEIERMTGSMARLAKFSVSSKRKISEESVYKTDED